MFILNIFRYGKVKIRLYLFLIKHYGMKAHGETEAYLQRF
jgi:hypothetical protein